jgi:hypothetical protein
MNQKIEKPTSPKMMADLQTSANLINAYPNPFNLSIAINYNIIKPGKALINVYNILGRQVKTLIDDYKETGSYKISWNGMDNFGQVLPSGFYLCQITTGTQRKTIKILMLK